MANFHCVLDASALIKKYHKEKGSEIVEALFEHNDSTIHLLNVAIPEVIGTFFRWQRKGKLSYIPLLANPVIGLVGLMWLPLGVVLLFITSLEGGFIAVGVVF